MRNTVHLTDARDFTAFRPLFQPLIDRALRGSFGRRHLLPLVQVPPAGPASAGPRRECGHFAGRRQWQANWKINRAEPKGGQRQAALRVQPFVRLGPADRTAIDAEGAALLAFAAAEADVRHVQFAPVG